MPQSYEYIEPDHCHLADMQLSYGVRPSADRVLLRKLKIYFIVSLAVIEYISRNILTDQTTLFKMQTRLLTEESVAIRCLSAKSREISNPPDMGLQ